MPCLDEHRLALNDEPADFIQFARTEPMVPRQRQLIAIRVDPGVLESFRKEARRRRVGYQTLINEVLAEHIRKDVA
jgi:uncharacterized protein (DUF4415 family)